MTPLQAQFETLKGAFSAAEAKELATGMVIISIPGYELPPGWSKGTTTLRFCAPVAYPHSKPDCFWVDADVRLAGGTMPANTAMQVLPEGSEPLLWFSYHVDTWHPSRDSLLTFERVIRNRLRELR